MAGWSKTAYRDFLARREYRQENDEKDRYEKQEPKEEAKEEKNPETERGEYIEDKEAEIGDGRIWTTDDSLALLTELRNSDPSGEFGNQIDRIKSDYTYYINELDTMKSLMREKESIINFLKDENAKLMMNQVTEVKEDLDTIKEDQSADIERDNDMYKGMLSAWKKRES